MFGLLGPRIHNLQPNGDHHENHKEILHQTGGGNFFKNLDIFYAYGPVSRRTIDYSGQKFSQLSRVKICKDPMHKKYQNFLKSPPLQFDAEFPCDSRGGLRLALSYKFEGLEAKT